MRIQILGVGCPKCKQLLANVERALEEMELEDVELEKVSDINEIMKYGIMMVPGLVIDGEVKSVGKALNPQEIKHLLNP